MVFGVCACLHVYFCTHMQDIVIQVPKMLQSHLPQRRPHVLHSLACLISQPSLTHHCTDMKKRVLLVYPAALSEATCSAYAAYEWCHILSSVSALFTLTNLTVQHSIVRVFACQAGLLSILLQMASATFLFSCPEQTSEKARTVSHCVDYSSSQSLTTDDVLVGCKTLLLGVGLK